MEKQTEIILDMLTADSVSILRKQYYEIDGKKYYDENQRNSYSNTEEDRAVIKEMLPDEYYNAVIAVWGEA